ncbi:hypothetical protein OROGR_001532 [Orobanche gracilis]
MSKSPWGNIGAWAADAERAEAEEREAAEKAAAAQPPPSFPSLKESVVTATKQKKKKKTTMSLQEFTIQQSSTYSGSATSCGLTHEEMFRLPTGPKERSSDDMQQGRLGGGFSNYGTRPGSIGSNLGRGREYEGRGSFGFQDEERRGSPRVSELEQPSRADEVDNWASTKKQMVPEYNSSQARPGGKYSSLGGRIGLGAASRADEVDNWASVKKAISQPQPQSRSSGFSSKISRPEPERWTHNEQRGEVAVVVKVNKANPFGEARPREDVLAEKGLDWKKLDLDIEGKKLQHSVSGGSRPLSSQSSRPDSPLSSKSELAMSENATKPKPKVNPFGNAKPREVLLEEKGLDWKKIDLDLEHRRVERDGVFTALLSWPKTEEEMNLKQEIERLNMEFHQQSGDNQTSIHDLILQKQQELGTLVCQLDDKVRYSQKTFGRQGSGAGFYERPPSRPGVYEESRGGGYLERPRSRPGTGSMERPPSRDMGAYEGPRANDSFGERSSPSRRGGYDEFRPGSHERPRSRQGVYEEPVRGRGFTQRSVFSTGGYDNERPLSRGTVDSWTRLGNDRGATQGVGVRGFFSSSGADSVGLKVVNFTD